MTFDSAPTDVSSAVFSSAEFRRHLSCFATGVAIVTCRSAAGELRGLTINSFSAVSLEPPLVLWSLAKTATSMTAFVASAHYAIHILSAEQKGLAEQFASSRGNRWEGVDYRLSEATGAPILQGALATFECQNKNCHDAGDHVIFVAYVVQCNSATLNQVNPLLYYKSRFYTDALGVSP